MEREELKKLLTEYVEDYKKELEEGVKTLRQKKTLTKNEKLSLKSCEEALRNGTFFTITDDVWHCEDLLEKYKNLTINDLIKILDDPEYFKDIINNVTSVNVNQLHIQYVYSADCLTTELSRYVTNDSRVTIEPIFINVIDSFGSQNLSISTRDQFGNLNFTFDATNLSDNKVIEGALNNLRLMGINPSIMQVSDIAISEEAFFEYKNNIKIYSNNNIVYKSLLKDLYTIFDENGENCIVDLVQSSIKQHGKTDQDYYKNLLFLQDCKFEAYPFAEKIITEILQHPLNKSEFYHLKSQEQEDLHFYMVKVDESNANFWRKFANAQQKNYGWIGFKPSYDIGLRYKDAESWVSFATNKELQNPDLPTKQDQAAMEMLVTTLTSEHTPFTTHMGISTSSLYQGKRHKKLSMPLHGFTAKAIMQDHHGKYYMITAPTDNMAKIMRQTAPKGKIFTGASNSDNDTNPVTLEGHKFTLKYGDGKIFEVQRTWDTKDLEELGWFVYHPHILVQTSNPLVTVELEALSNLSHSGDIEHFINGEKFVPLVGKDELPFSDFDISLS